MRFKKTKTRIEKTFSFPASFTTTPTFAVQNSRVHSVHAVSLWCISCGVCTYCPLGYLCARLQSLTPTFRAVEVFIRDKYERKKYYNKEALATAQVSINNTVCVLKFVSVCYCCGSMQRCHGWRRFHVTSVWVVAWWLFDCQDVLKTESNINVKWRLFCLLSFAFFYWETSLFSLF